VLVDNGLELLTEEECRNLLGTESVGRVAVSVGALPAIFPVNYTTVGDDVMFITGEGLKLRAALENTVVGFEVDSLDPALGYGWSVMLVGVAKEVSPAEREHLGPIRISPWAGGDRTHLVRIHPEMISGRRIVPPGQGPNRVHRPC
jgi:nitroimidazol reductase NimA-like FMN-containing flavoprotein (pyridoxamine 5'-phosphate oxidase superfamily)